jgi:PAS domain S-box-containing protein
MMRSAEAAPSIPQDGDRYRLLVNSITDYAIYMLDLGGIVTSWNPGAQRFMTYTGDEIIGRHFSTFYTEAERRAGVPEDALRIAAEEGRFEREGWRVKKDGTQFWAHVVIDPIRAPSGDLIGYAKITRDLTERRGVEQALRQREEQFKLLVQGVTDYAIYMLDRDGAVISWNAGAERIKGYLPEEVIGSHFSRFYTESDRETGLPGLGLETAAREGRWEQEGWRVRKDGSWFWAHVVVDAIRDDDGEVIGFAKVTRDITERMEAQRALEVARDALQQSQKLEAIGQLTGGVAHDFNNLLMAVLGSLELVRKRLPYDPRITPLIDNAIHGAQRGSTLTQRMLAFARKQELRLEPVDLASVVRGMMNFLQRSIGPGSRIQTRFRSDLPRIKTDVAQLENALLNLVLNARDAMPRGGTITITAERRGGEKAGGEADFVCLVVTDTGEGMTAETVARAAEPFFTTKGVGKGTGLGLSMVHGLVAQGGGHLNIKSKPGEGTVVELCLPIAAEEVAALSDAPTGARTGQPEKRLTILAVDDDQLVLVNTVALLEDLGHEVLMAASGGEALEILAQTPAVDIVVTDQAMPNMTGIELSERLRGASPNLPILIVTGYAEIPPGPGQDLPRLAKPFSQDELSAAVEAAVAGSF